MKNSYFILLILTIIILLYLINKKYKHQTFDNYNHNYKDTKTYKVSKFFQDLINNFTFGKEIDDSSRYTRVQF
tara:strand:- start:408 stop:626 length:219 start_codon:yes stop_codon:yes gene_type:complete